MIIKPNSDQKILKVDEVEAFIKLTDPSVTITYNTIVVNDPYNKSGNDAKVIQIAMADGTGMKMYEYNRRLMVKGFSTGGDGGFWKALFNTNRTGLSVSCMNLCRKISARFDSKMFRGGI